MINEGLKTTATKRTSSLRGRESPRGLSGRILANQHHRNYYLLQTQHRRRTVTQKRQATDEANYRTGN